MEISLDLAHEYRSELSDCGRTAPMEVFGALLTLGEPSDLLTWFREEGQSTTWLVVGRMNGGLVVVEAWASTPGWVWDPKHQGERSAEARWYPLDAIESVQVVDVNLSGGGSGSVNGRNSWRIALRGRDDLLLPPHPTDTLDDFCRELIQDRSPDLEE